MVFFMGKKASTISLPSRERLFCTMDSARLLPSSRPFGTTMQGTCFRIRTALSVISSGSPGPMPST